MSLWGRHVGVALVFVGWMMSGLGLIELRKVWHSQTSPTFMTCAELGNRGPLRGLYVTLTDYTPDVEGILLQERDDGEWQQADVPLLDDSFATAKVIARMAHHRQPPGELPATTLAQPLTGLVERFGHWPEGRQVLAELNPELDPAECWVLQVGQTPSIAWQLQALVLGGMVLFAMGVPLLLMAQSPAVDIARFMVPIVLLLDGVRWLGSRLPIPLGMRGLLLSVLAAALLAVGSLGILYLREMNPVDALLQNHFLSLFGSVLAMNVGGGFVLLAIYWMFTDRRISSGQMLGHDS